MTAPAAIVIVVEEIGAGRYSCLIVASSRQPFLDAARVMLSEGHDPETMLIMRRPGCTTDDLRGKLRVAAKLTVKDNRVGRPTFVKHQADAESIAPAPYSDLDDSAATGAHPAEINESLTPPAGAGI